MRMTAIGVSLLCVAALAAAPATATVLLADTFAYADGDLATVSGGNWTIHSGSGTDIQVVGGTATGSAGNSPDDSRTFAARGPSDKTYACFMAKIPTRSASPMTGVTYYDEPAIGQPGYEKRVANLFKDKGLPQKASRI